MQRKEHSLKARIGAEIAADLAAGAIAEIVDYAITTSVVGPSLNTFRGHVFWGGPILAGASGLISRVTSKGLGGISTDASWLLTTGCHLVSAGVVGMVQYGVIEPALRAAHAEEQYIYFARAGMQNIVQPTLAKSLEKTVLVLPSACAKLSELKTAFFARRAADKQYAALEADGDKAAEAIKNSTRPGLTLNGDDSV